MNVPSTLGTNWKWRMIEQDLDDELLEKIGNMTVLYERAQDFNKQTREILVCLLRLNEFGKWSVYGYSDN